MRPLARAGWPRPRPSRLQAAVVHLARTSRELVAAGSADTLSQARRHGDVRSLPRRRAGRGVKDVLRTNNPSSDGRSVGIAKLAVYSRRTILRTSSGRLPDRRGSRPFRAWGLTRCRESSRSVPLRRHARAKRRPQTSRGRRRCVSVPAQPRPRADRRRCTRAVAVGDKPARGSLTAARDSATLARMDARSHGAQNTAYPTDRRFAFTMS